MSSVPFASSALPDADGRIPLAARRHPFVARLATRLRRRCGVEAGAIIAVGVSGGADSVALLTALAVLRDRGREHRRITPVAVHVHHHLRGIGADQDASFVESLATNLGMPLVVRHIEPGRENGNTAAIAREQRYAALRTAAAGAGAAHVAVAHHADDQLETMLIALGRGAGLAGLGGMPWTRPLGDGITLIRPLLETRRAQCESFCAAAGTGWRDDPSNEDPRNLRARVRRDLLPVIESIWPNAAARATSTADAVETARGALSAALAPVFGSPATRAWPRSALAALPPSLIAAGLRRAALDADGAVADLLGQRLLLPAAEAIADGTRRPRVYAWPRGLRLTITAPEVTLVRQPRTPNPKP